MMSTEPSHLYTGFTNANAMLHVANCAVNAARIESGDRYKFYAGHNARCTVIRGS